MDFPVTNAAKSKMESFAITLKSLRALAEKEAKLVETAMKGLENHVVDPDFILNLTKSIHGTTEKSISDYILKNKVILLNEQSSVLRRQVLESMKLQLTTLHKKITFDGQKLADDVTSFMELIENNEKLASESLKKVIKIAKATHETTELIKETQDKKFLLQRDVDKLEEELLEYLMCAAFLDILSPPESRQLPKFIIPEDFLKKCFCFTNKPDENATSSKDTLEKLLESEKLLKPIQVHLKSPEGVMKMIEKLRDSNLSLVRNSCISKGPSNDEMKEIEETKEKMEKELQSWDERIQETEGEIEKAKQEWVKLKELNKRLNEEYLESEHRENQMSKIAEIYRLCTGSTAKTADLTLMMASIDFFLDGLLKDVNQYPKKTIKLVMTKLEAEKKQSEKKALEILRTQRVQERLQKTLGIVSKTPN